jgi:hypothetical protein
MVVRRPLLNKDLQHTAAHCNTLQHIATHCNTLQHADLIGWLVWKELTELGSLRVLCVAVCCSVLQCHIHVGVCYPSKGLTEQRDTGKEGSFVETERERKREREKK